MSSKDFKNQLGYVGAEEIVHRDNISLLTLRRPLSHFSQPGGESPPAGSSGGASDSDAGPARGSPGGAPAGGPARGSAPGGGSPLQGSSGESPGSLSGESPERDGECAGAQPTDNPADVAARLAILQCVSLVISGCLLSPM